MARSLEKLQRQYNSSSKHGPGPGGPGHGPGPGPGPGGPGKMKRKPKNTRATVTRLLGYLKPYYGHFALVFLCMILSTVTSLIGSYMLAPVINKLTLTLNPSADVSPGTMEKLADTVISHFAGNGDTMGYIGAALAVLGVVYAVGIVTNYLQSKLMLRISTGSVEKIRNDLFENLQKLPVRYFDSHPTGELMSRFTNDVDNIDMMVNNSLTSLVSGVITLVGTMVFMLTTNLLLTAITVAFVPIFAKGGSLIAGLSSKYFAGQQAALGALNGYMEETVTGQKVVKVFNHEQECVEEFGLLNDDMRDKQFRAQFWGGVMGPIMGNTSQIAYGVTVGVGGILMCTAGMTPGALTVFAGYSRQFSMPINNISQQMSTVFAALAGAERVFQVMDSPKEGEPGADPIAFMEGMEPIPPMPFADKEGVPGPDPMAFADGTMPIPPMPFADREGAPGPDPMAFTGGTLPEFAPVVLENIEGNVVLKDVDFGYKPDKLILKGINLYARPGQKIAFVGSTGAGKTTITNLLNRFYDIGKGSITIDGVDIRSIDRSFLRRNIAMVLQDTNLFTGTVMENIRYGRLDATDDEVIAAAKTASAHSFIMRLEHGYDTVLEGNGSNLSQGQRQLLNIARAAVSKAPILVLDEATSSVDTRTERHIEHGMERLMKNRTTFVIAHRLSTVRDSDAIMVLEQGEIIERGSHEELLAMKGRYYELYTGVRELD